jgi:tRNA A-37 threonylcarbamoyl transferase component Bud32
MEVRTVQPSLFGFLNPVEIDADDVCSSRLLPITPIENVDECNREYFGNIFTATDIDVDGITMENFLDHFIDIGKRDDDDDHCNRFRGFEIKGFIAEGGFGSVLRVQRLNKVLAIKIQILAPDDSTVTYNDVIREYKLQRNFANNGIAAPIVGMCVRTHPFRRFTKIIVFFMEQIHETLSNWLDYEVHSDERHDQMFEALERIVSKMANLNICHGDMHEGNIAIYCPGEGKKAQVRLIDFGQSTDRFSYQIFEWMQLYRCLFLYHDPDEPRRSLNSQINVHKLGMRIKEHVVVSGLKPEGFPVIDSVETLEIFENEFLNLRAAYTARIRSDALKRKAS